MILGQVTKIDQFSAARNGVLCEKKNKKKQWQLGVDVFIKLLFQFSPSERHWMFRLF